MARSNPIPPKSPPDRHENVRRYRARLRGEGLRPLTIWVPDTNAPGFAQECRQQSQLVADESAERWFDAWSEAQDFSDWTA